MRKATTVIAVLLSATLASTVALAAARHRHNESTRDEFTWSEDGAELNLHAYDDSGLIVGRTMPSPFHGLATGDVITAVGDRRVAHVNDLLQALRDQCPTSATLHLRRAGAPIAVTWNHSECQILVPPPPPAPAPPPPPVSHY